MGERNAMKRSKFTESQIVFALKQAETGVAVAEVCRKLGHQRSHVLQLEEEVRRDLLLLDLVQD